MKTNKCIVCSKKINNKKIKLCADCFKNPFRVEEARTILARGNRLSELKSYYLPNLAEIKNFNTGKFWDSKLGSIHLLKNQDGMTRDRISVASRFLSPKSKRILDVGAGAGYLEEIISKRKKIEIFANDISPLVVKNLKRRFMGHFTVESLYNLKYPKGFFDAIFILEVIEHIPPSKILKFLKNIKRMLKNKGQLIISVPLNEGLEEMKNNPNSHLRVYTTELITKELELSGFKIIEKKYFFAFSKYYKLKKVFSLIFKSRWEPNNVLIKATL